MFELIPICVVAIVLSLLSHKTSEYDLSHYCYRRKDRFWFAVMAVAMILFVGLRTGYNDTGTYQHIYNSIPKDVSLTDGIDWLKVGDNPGFEFTNRVLVRLGFSTQSYLMFYAVVTVSIFLWFLRKYTCDLPFSIFLFVTFAGYTFTLAAIKQCMAMALCLIATDCFIKKRRILFVIFIFIATLYHPYSLMYLIIPFMTFRPWSSKTVVMLGVFAATGVLLESLIGTILDVTDLLGENYDASSFTGEGVNPFRLMAVSVPIILSYITRRQIEYKNDKVQNMMVNLTMLNAEIMFIALFGTANYFARLANYFLTFQALSVPWLFTHFNERSKRLLTGAAVICYVFFFVYSNAIKESFDHHFYSITLREYLESLF